LPSNVEVTLEHAPCPVGCPPSDRVVLTGRDRLHGLPGEFTVVRCETCGLMRTDPRPNLETIGKFYPEEYGPYRDTRVAPDDASVSRIPLWKRLARRILSPDTRQVPSVRPGRMLEVGCASGSFLFQMARAGWDVSGIEFSESAATAARSAGYRVHVGPLDSAPDADRLYDLIVGWMVLEHLPNPIHALRRLSAWSKPGAWLAMSVPDAGSLEFRVFGDAWYALDLPRHLFHFTRRTIGRTLGLGGWKVRRILWHSNPNNLLHSLRYVCLDRRWTPTADLLREVIEGRRAPRARLMLGRLLGLLHASGRMTIWAQRDERPEA
jgi:SAM-dependent methyltransferase